MCAFMKTAAETSSDESAQAEAIRSYHDVQGSREIHIARPSRDRDDAVYLQRPAWLVRHHRSALRGSRR